MDRIAATLDAARAGRVDLLGYSLGGRLALAFALSHRNRVRRLVLEGASPGLRDEVEREARREEDEERAGFLERKGVEPFVEAWEAHPTFRTQKALPRAVREGERIRRLAGDADGWAAALRTLGTGVQPSFWGELPTLDTPTLLLTGEEDRKFTAIAREMAAMLPSSHHRVIAGAGHRTHLEAPERWLDEVRWSLDEVEEGQFQL